jgi:hypothetical protein
MKNLLFILLIALSAKAQIMPTYFPTYEANRGKGNGRLYYKLYSLATNLVFPETEAAIDAFFTSYGTFRIQNNLAVSVNRGTINSSTSSTSNLINFTNTTQLTSAIGNATPYSGFDGEYYGLIISGYFTPKQTGTYKFSVEGDDAVDIFINGTNVANHYGGHGPSAIGTHSGSISLIAGKKYNLRVRFMEKGAGDQLFLFWQKPTETSGSVWYQDSEEISTEEVIPNGLVLHVDPSNMYSYPKTGTSVADTRGNASGTFAGNITYSNLGQGSFLTDGNSDVIDFTKTPANFPAGDISIFMWVRASSLNNGWNIILTKWFTDYLGYGGYSDFHYAIYPNGSSLYQNLYTSYQSNMFGSTPITTNTWYYLGFTISSGNMQMYLNGALDGPVRSNAGRINYTQSLLWYGDGRSGVGGFTGNLGSLSIYNRGLTFDEVIQNYHATKTKYGY